MKTVSAYITRSNIAHDLNISPHYQTVQYADSSIKYIFSSELYRNNFEKRLQENRESISRSLSNRFGFNIKADKLADLKLYTSIEKRGFLILIDGVKAECLSSITLDGQTMTMRS